MSRVIVGTWGKNLAIRIPFDVARTIGLSEGEQIDIEAQDGDLVLRRPAARARLRADAEAAAAEIIADSTGRTLREISIKDLLADGRRG